MIDVECCFQARVWAGTVVVFAVTASSKIFKNFTDI